MDLQHVNAKIFVDGELTVDLERFIEVFHRWIADRSMNELLIDVADYRHVPAGPGVVLVGHEADYAIDNTGGRFGLLYSRKAPLDGSNEDRFRQAFQSAAHACSLLESEFTEEGPLKFSRQEFALLINDRLLAPNTAETFEASKPDIGSFLERVFGHNEFSVERQNDDERSRFGVIVKLAKPFDLSAILDAV